MSKKEIKADKISVEGDFIRVESKSTRGAGAVVGGILGSLVAPGAGTIIGGVLGAAAGDDGRVRLIPKSDVAEIKEDSSGQIRVIVDENRNRSRR